MSEPKVIALYGSRFWLPVFQPLASLTSWRWYQLLTTRLFYTDEGFLLAKRLKQFGVLPRKRLCLV